MDVKREIFTPEQAAEYLQLERDHLSLDVHVVQAALEVRSLFLLTLDKGLCSEVNKARLDIQALSPGEFIKTVLPNHVDYPPADN